MTEHRQSDDEDTVTRTPPELDDDSGAEPIVVPRPGAPSLPMDPPEDPDA